MKTFRCIEPLWKLVTTERAPGDVVAKHSTNTTLTVFAYGGEAGGMLYVTGQNIGKLVRVGGSTVTFPYAAFVPPNGGVPFSIEYEADTHSDSEGDITVTATLIQGDSEETLSDSASTTAVKVLLEAPRKYKEALSMRTARLKAAGVSAAKDE